MSKIWTILNLKWMWPATGQTDSALAKELGRKDSALAYGTGVSRVGGVFVGRKGDRGKKLIAV